MVARSSSNLVLLMVFTALGIVVILLGVSNMAVRVIFSVPLVLILPGYTLMVASFPKNGLGVAERLLFSLGLSLAIAVLGGLALNRMPWGLRADSWVVLLGSVTLGAGLVALLRHREYPAVDAGQLSAGLYVHRALLFGLAALVAAGAIAVARTGALQQPRPAFTQLWILPADETDQGAVRIGVRSMEPSAKLYRLQVEVSGRVVREWPLIGLEPGERWETTVLLPTERPETGTVEAVLFLPDLPLVAYRRVVLWRGLQSK